MCFKFFIYFIIIVIFWNKTININALSNGKKNIRDQVDNLQLEVVKMSLQLSEMLKQKTGKGLDVSS